MTTDTYRVDLSALTVIHTDEHGEDFDLNAGGEPCGDEAGLEDFIRELHTQGAYDAATRDALLAEVNTSPTQLASR